MKVKQRRTSFEDSASRLYGCLAQGIALFVPLASLAAYAFSSQFRRMITPGKFVMCILGWAEIAIALGWLRRAVQK